MRKDALPCPNCGQHMRVIDSRHVPGRKPHIRRRRACVSCGERLTTLEHFINAAPPRPPHVVEQLMFSMAQILRANGIDLDPPSRAA